MPVKLGEKVTDSLTGFVGIATARTEYLWGRPKVCVEPKQLHNCKPVDGQWFDEERLADKTAATDRHHCGFGSDLPVPSDSQPD